MFCPKCSMENQTDTIYCRQCGFSLTIVQAALARQIQESVTKFEESRKPLKVGTILLSIFSLLGFFTILLAIINGSFNGGMFAIFIPGLIFSLPLILTGTIKSGRALNAIKAQIRSDTLETDQIKSAEPRQLEVPPDVVSRIPISVTENTTQNLTIPKERG